MADDSHSLEGSENLTRNQEVIPSPLDLQSFLSWAVGRLQITHIIEVNKVILTDLTHAKSKAKDDLTVSESKTATSMNIHPFDNTVAVVDIELVYDNRDMLVQIRFRKNREVPEDLLKLLSLVARFHPYLTTINIDKGLNQFGMYQLSRLVASSNITDLILDSTTLSQANYYVLFEEANNLKYLSLARCNLNGAPLKKLTEKLEFPSQASKMITALNLSTNGITDEGAKLIGDILRLNRQISYLNLSGNLISDKGADIIFSCLTMFPLTAEEMSNKRSRKFLFMTEKKRVIRETAKNMRNNYKQPLKKKLSKAANTPSKTGTSTVDPDLGLSFSDFSWIEKAEVIVEEMMGQFQDPLNVENTIAEGEIMYCFGNNTLSYLNLAYNNLTYFSVQKLYEVLNIQHTWRRLPRGLVNVCIEGNNLPETCKELSEIDILIDNGLSRNIGGISKKKPTGRK